MNKAFRKWFKSLLDSSQALIDGRNNLAEVERENKLAEADHAALVRRPV